VDGVFCGSEEVGERIVAVRVDRFVVSDDVGSDGRVMGYCSTRRSVLAEDATSPCHVKLSSSFDEANFP